jgi:lysophospholipase L1-like esterase
MLPDYGTKRITRKHCTRAVFASCASATRSRSGSVAPTARSGRRDVEILNAGVAGYDTTREVALLNRLLSRYKPDLVLLVFLPNDLAAQEEPARTQSAIRRADEKYGGLHSAELLKRWLLQSDLLYSRLYRSTYRSRIFDPRIDHDRITEDTRRLLRRAREQCQASGARFAVVSLPQLFQVISSATGRAPSGSDPGRIDRLFQAVAREDGYPWVAVLPALAQRYRAGERDLYFRLDGHLTPAGNREVARIIADHWDILGGSDREARPVAPQ